MSESKDRWRDMIRAFPTLTEWAATKSLADATEILRALGLRWPDDPEHASGRSEPGDDEGDPTWVDEEPWIGRGARYGLLFCLDVWNSSARSLLPPEMREWSIVSAFSRWDDEHRSVARAYFADPFYP